MAKQRALSLQHSGYFRQAEVGTQSKVFQRTAKHSPMKLSEQLRAEREMLFGESEHRKAINEMYEHCGFKIKRMAVMLDESEHVIRVVLFPSNTPAMATVARVGNKSINYLVQLTRSTNNVD